MHLTTRSRYGTRIILDIALFGNKEPVRIAEIAKRQGVSVKYLEKIVQTLRKAKLIKSKRGPNGGHVLSRPLETITVGELVRILEGDQFMAEATEIEDCLVVDKDTKMCLASRVWNKAGSAMLDMLDSIRCSDLLAEAKSHMSNRTHSMAA